MSASFEPVIYYLYHYERKCFTQVHRKPQQFQQHWHLEKKKATYIILLKTLAPAMTFHTFDESDHHSSKNHRSENIMYNEIDMRSAIKLQNVYTFLKHFPEQIYVHVDSSDPLYFFFIV